MFESLIRQTSPKNPGKVWTWKPSQEVGKVDHRDSWLFLSILVGSFNILDQKHLNEVLTVMVLVDYVDPESVDPVWSWSSKSLVFRPSTCRIINTDISFGCTNYWCSGSILQIGPVWRISCISQGSCAGKNPKNLKGLLWSRCFGWRSWVRFHAGIMCCEFTWTNSPLSVLDQHTGYDLEFVSWW